MRIQSGNHEPVSRPAVYCYGPDYGTDSLIPLYQNALNRTKRATPWNSHTAARDSGAAFFTFTKPDFSDFRIRFQMESQPPPALTMM